MCAEYEQIKKANIMISSLCIFTSIKEDSVLTKYGSLLKYLNKKEISIEKAISFYNDFTYELLNSSNITSLKRYILDKLFLDNNAFTSMIDSENLDNKHILEQVKYELKALQYITSIKSKDFKDYIILKGKAKNFEAEIINSLIDFEVDNNLSLNEPKAIDKLKSNIINSENWDNLIDDIIEFYKKYGTGIFGEYRAFVWEHEDDKTYLRGVEAPDPVRLKDLAGYENQKEVIIKNTEQFLKGYPANNILLYGSRGTGKSSTVKAIINEYYSQGLRLIEVDKEKLVDFTKIIKILKNKNLKFIVFVDDLVFEEGESSYSALKTILEGGIENRSNNILIYATTNRKHLVKETFSERAGDEVHAHDSIEEKLSLADRFGMTVSFYSPDQKEYLQVIDSIAESRGIDVDKEYLHAEALKWVRWYNARSPRTAVQFINWLQGELAK
ncbi:MULTISPECIES: ATP-binding protein [unclassified Clostridium]|uniref:ATP-binding protein n=1 Tax=unclassified Clostridium TaxID=2614128 RepID=UPI00029848DC|nr:MULTISPECIES: ATP-binding protein [unclassified Clostridium]EKQ54428.1 MAG: putative ATPase (AAA+ superfamily) [Clostridium sp. Maddingley MBC34-26]